MESTNIDRVWVRLKTAAESFIESRQCISYREARSIVARLLQEEHVDITQSDVLDYLAYELFDQIAEVRPTVAS